MSAMALSGQLLTTACAQALLHHLRQLATGSEATRLIVATGTGNLPACTLYHHFGFHAEHEEEIVPGLFLTYFALSL